MNIFVVDKSPVICAQALCDLRLNKMILETAQLLCNAYRYWHSKELVEYNKDIIYKVTHDNHPCSIWLKKDVSNYKWLLNYFYELNEERLVRTSKTHLSFTKLYNMLFEASPYSPTKYDYEVDFTFNCANLYPSSGNVFTDYKLCLINKWLQDVREPTWHYRGPPSFVIYNIKNKRTELNNVNQFEKPILQRKLLINHLLWGKHGQDNI